ncbi:hypothetical protein OIU79_027247 [Salix purpurea]|uniref:F-box associated beta-propeller type 3 domain-containing protein n=1 Tax=Salix purpurea TaxID=77065 RepID=A0A9Q0VTU7_SALPP|nr:hypothetical protein OIU79_027247 [Salix purpurea]
MSKLPQDIVVDPVDFEAASEGDEDNAVQELEYPDVIRCSPPHFIGIMGSCDGLICLQVDYEKLVLWNPSTRDHKELPKPSPYHNYDFFSGLGYDSSIDDYKFVIPSCSTANGSEQIMVEVLTLRTNVWRKVPEICQGTTLQRRDSRKFWGCQEIFLCAFGECHGSYFEAWIHEQEYDSSASFRRLSRLPADRISQEPKAVSCLTKKGELLLDYDEWQLELYHPVEDKNKCIRTYRDGDSCDLELYMESLVSINDDES